MIDNHLPWNAFFKESQFGKRSMIRNVSTLLFVPSRLTRYWKNPFAIDEKTGFCADWKVRAEGMNILPEESCVTLRNSMVCSTSKSGKINSLAQSFSNAILSIPIRVLYRQQIGRDRIYRIFDTIYVYYDDILSWV